MNSTRSVLSSRTGGSPSFRYSEADPNEQDDLDFLEEQINTRIDAQQSSYLTLAQERVASVAEVNYEGKFLCS